MERQIFTEDHEAFRDTVRTFLDKEAVPYHDQWEKDGQVDRELWRKAGAQGLLGTQIDEQYGGGGVLDFRYNTVLNEEVVRSGCSGIGFSLHNDVVAPYLMALANEEQKQRWLPGFCSGEQITAIAMTEPGTGSDLQSIRTTAVRDGDHYVLNGQKTFITNGILSDLVIVVARTDQSESAGAKALSLLVVERGMAGFERGRNLEKVGLKAQDTAELFFTDVRVPAANLLGEEGMGFVYLMQNLPQERLSIATVAAAACEHVVEVTKQYVRERKAFGRSIGKFQNTRFELAEMATEAQVARVFVDRCITDLNAGKLSVVDAAMAKYWTTDLQNKIVDRCLQLHGGYGYMMEYPVAKAFVDSRVQRIYGGTNEIMKEIIGRSLDL